MGQGWSRLVGGGGVRGFECLDRIMKGGILRFTHLSSTYPHITYHPSVLLSHYPTIQPYSVPGLFQALGTQIELNHPITPL